MDSKNAKRVIGLGGIFFKANDPQKMHQWYEKHLGIQGKPEEGAMFHWRRGDDPLQESFTVWSIFPQTQNILIPAPRHS